MLLCQNQGSLVTVIIQIRRDSRRVLELAYAIRHDGRVATI